MRGNQDNPAYFDGETFRHRRMMCMPDYSIIQACSHTILCVGGGISIDRVYRKDKWQADQKKRFRGILAPVNDRLDKHFYWTEEVPILDDVQLHKINQKFAVDIVITHTTPSFCEL